MSEKRAVFDEAGKIRDRAAIIFELVVKLRVRQAVEQDHIYALGRWRGVVDYRVERTAVLALQTDLRSRTGRVETVDFWKSHHPRDGRGYIDVPAAQLETPRTHSGPAEQQRRAALYDVERAMLPGLDSICIRLGADREIGSARAVEELCDSLVSIGMTQYVRLEVGAIGVVGRVTAPIGGVEFLFDRGNDKRILVCYRVHADLFDNLERERAAFIGEALETNHPAPRPDLVRIIAPGRNQIDLIRSRSFREQSEDRSIARFVLMGVEALAGQPLGPEFPRFRFVPHATTRSLLIKKR